MTETSGSDETHANTTVRAIRDGIDDAYAKASKTAHAAVERTRDGLEQARDKVNDAYSSGRGKASDAYASARQKTTEGFENNPLAVLLGGIAIGAALGALLPRTEREAKVLGAVGEKVRGAAGEAIEAAKGAGRDKLDELGLSKDHARETMKSLLDGAIAAAGSAGAAALDSARKKGA
ncbi:hypothetical protein [Sphingomonas oryzagri]